MTCFNLISYIVSGNFYRRASLLLLLSLSFCTVFGQAPNISFDPSSYTFTINTPITPVQPKNYGGVLTGCTIDKLLPAGLIFNPATGSIDGTPTAVTPFTTYTITAANASGNSSATVRIRVTSASASQVTANPPVISYATPNRYDVGVPIALTPTNTGGAVPPGNFGLVSTFAGSGTAATTDGTGRAASFRTPQSLARDADGNIYVVEQTNRVIRKITPTGEVSLFAGKVGIAGSTNGPRLDATFNNPYGVVVDSYGNVFVSDAANHVIRKIDAATGLVSTFAGTVGTMGLRNDIGTDALFKGPLGMAIDATDNIFLADNGNHVIRKIEPDGNVSTFSGTGVQGNADGQAGLAQFQSPKYISIDALGNLYVTGSASFGIRKVTAGGEVSTIPGLTGVNIGAAGKVIGRSDGSLIIASFSKHQILEVKADGTIVVLAGGGTQGSADGKGTAASFNRPEDMIYGGDGNLYIVDVNNNTIRKMVATGFVIDKALPPGITFDQSGGTFTGSPIMAWPITDYKVTAYNSAGPSLPFTVSIAVNAAPPIVKPNISYATPNIYAVNQPVLLSPANTGGAVPAKEYAGPPEDVADLKFPWGLAVDRYGYLYATERALFQIQRINVTTGIVEKVAGNTDVGNKDDVGELARFNNPIGVAVDVNGNIYIADRSNGSIRKITWGIPGTVTTFKTGLTAPQGLAFDAAGNLYVTDRGNGAVIKYDTQTGTAVTLTTGLNRPSGLDIDADGNIYVAETDANAIKKISPTGAVSLFKDGLVLPYDVKVDGSGNVYVTDEQNTGSLKRISPNKDVTTIANTNADPPRSLALDKLGNLYIGFDNKVRKINISGYTINKPLPVGLNFDPKTGVISGSATANSPATDYIVTAYNGGGSSSFTINIKIEGTVPSVGNPPRISYATPQIYTVNKKIDDLMPTNTGGAVPQLQTAYGVAAPVLTGLVNVGSVAVDADGFIYICEGGNNQIKKIDPATKQVIATYGTGSAGSDNGPVASATFTAPKGIALDRDGNIYVSESTTHLIRKISKAGMVTTLAGSGAAGSDDGTGVAASFNSPQGLTVDALGNVYVADQGNNLVRKISSGGIVTTLNIGTLNKPSDLTLDKAGNLYIAEVGAGTNTGSVKLLAPNGTLTVFKDGQTAANAIEVDGTGSTVYMNGNLRLAKTGDVTNIGIFNAVGLAMDSQGSLFITELGALNMNTGRYQAGTLKSIAVSGYTINQPLPSGLDLDPKTGRISGTPTVSTASDLTFTITAYNADGSHSTRITLRINKAELIPQTITFPAIPAKLICDAPFQAGATSTNTSGAPPITYKSSDITVATIDATGKITLTGKAGTTNITASQAEDITYAAAADKVQPLVVAVTAKPTVTITPGKTAICTGETVTYTAAVASTMGMGTLTYQWQIDGNNVNGATTSTYTPSTAINKIGCTITSAVTVAGGGVCTNSGVLSIDAIKETPFRPAGVSIQSSAPGAVCAGTAITFTATATPAASNFNYQWQLNGTNVGTNSATYSDNKFANGDKVSCIVTNNTTPCLTGTPATAETTVQILPPDSPVPTVSITASATSVYAENPVTFTARPQNASGTVNYQWQINGSNVGTNSPAFTSTTLKNADRVRVIMTAGTCTVSVPSNDLSPTILPPLVILPPNTFTPNGDGINDLWLISGLSTYPNCLVNVYNRNGENVFTSRGYSQPWDGFYKSKNLPVGTYYYTIDLANGKPWVKGYLTLIR